MIKALQEERPTVMRYPGGLYGNFFHWQETIGPLTQRKKQSVNGELPDQVPQLGVDEFLRFLSNVAGCEALMIVNISKSSQWKDGTAKEAAAWVAYCNAMPDNNHPLGVDETDRDWKTAGYWAAQRAHNGHPMPYHVKYWELGNELNQAVPAVYKSKEYLLTAEEYAQRAADFIDEMRAIDPSIKIGIHGYSESCQPANNPVSFKGGGPWMPTVLRALSGKFDFFVWHHYNSLTLDGIPHRDRDIFCKAVLGWSLYEHEPELKKIKPWLQAAAPTSEIWLTEYYRFAGIDRDADERRGRNLIVALGCADYIMQNIMSPDLDAAQHFGFNAGGCGSIFPGSAKVIFGQKTPPGVVVRFPIHWVFALFGSSVFREGGGTILNPQIQCGQYHVMGRSAPEVRAVAAVNQAHNHLDILLLNKNLERPVTVAIELSGVGKRVKAIQATELNTWKKQSDYPPFDDNNSVATANVYLKPQPPPAVNGTKINGALPPHSLTLYSCEMN